MQHYICTGGCAGESGSSGVCQAEGCKKEGELLTPCECADSTHQNPAPEVAEKENE